MFQNLKILSVSPWYSGIIEVEKTTIVLYKCSPEFAGKKPNCQDDRLGGMIAV